MLGTTQQTKTIKVIELALFFGLCGLSAFFMYGVLDRFISGKTSFTQFQEPIQELPTIMLCFSMFDSDETYYEYGSYFKIKYERYNESIEYFDHVFLKEGENSTIMDEIVYLEKITTLDMGNCFKITVFSINKYIKGFIPIKLYFNEEEDFHTLDIFFTSAKNSYGVVGNWWLNGKVMKAQVNKGMYKKIDLKQEQYRYMTTATNNKCSYESYYECMSRLISANLDGSLEKCSLVSLPSLPICKIKSDYVLEEFWSNWDKAEEKCPIKLCITLEYSGVSGYYKKLNDKNVTVGFAYKISSNSMTIYEEYLIYDVISMVGSVGGTLGMCIGFSFTGAISFLINVIQNLSSLPIINYCF